MQIIDTLITESGEEILYLFDENSGRVIKVFVDDYTDSAPARDYQEERPAPRKRRGLVRTPIFPEAFRKKLPHPAVQERYEEKIEPEPEKRTDLPLKPVYPMPPHLASVFGGAAEEKRTA